MFLLESKSEELEARKLGLSFIFYHVISHLKVHLTAKDTWDPSGVTKSTPIPFPYWFTAPSKYIFHAPSSIPQISSSRKSSFPSSPFMGFSAQKTNTALPLIVFLFTYLKSNSDNRINHLNNHPLKASFSNRYFNGSILLLFVSGMVE